MSALIVLAATNVSTLAALLLSLKWASDERRILNAANFEAKQFTDAARRAAGPTHAEAKAAVDQQLKIKKELQETGGTFSSANPFAAVKPEGL